MAAKGDDLILIVGPSEVRLPADSHILKKCSSVFAKMLGPNFKEGKQSDIRLPEDSSDAFKLILDHTHFRFQTLKNNEAKIPKAPTVRDVATLCDKYDLFANTLLSTQIKAWLKELSPYVLEEWYGLLETAYILDDGERFGEASAAMLDKFAHSYRVLVSPSSSPSYLHPMIPLLLEEKRTYAKSVISAFLWELSNTPSACSGHSCDLNATISKIVMSELSLSVLGPEKITAAALTTVLQYLTQNFIRKFEKDDGEKLCTHVRKSQADVVQRVRDLCEKVKKHTRLCLPCVYAAVGNSSRSCYQNHTIKWR